MPNFTFDRTPGSHSLAAVNVTRRGISFNEASTVLEDPLSTTFPDEAHSESEMRFLTIGTSHRERLLVVAHT